MSDCASNSQQFDFEDDVDVDLEAPCKTSLPTAVSTRATAVTPPELCATKRESYDCWSIDDDPFFYPRGLLAHGNSAGKCVFVTWSPDHLLNFVFKKSSRTHRTTMTQARLNIEPNDKIADLLITELNTLLLMRSGRIYYFISVKSIKPIDWLASGVRCIASSAAGFSLIRLLDGNVLNLETYRDVACVGESTSTLLQRYNITFDSNLFDCPWADERFTVCSLTILSEEHVPFVELVIGRASTLRTGQEVHFFTVSGHVFALIADIPATAHTVNVDTSHYTIQLLNSYASNVAFMRVLVERKMCLVFLECGSIDIWYWSAVAHGLRRQTHHTGAEYTHYHYASDTNRFYYTDERCVAQLSFTYNAAEDACHVNECIKGVPGIVAVTWATSLQQLVVLSCNNFFYRLTYDEADTLAGNGTKQQSTTEFEDLHQLYDMTTERVTKLLQKTHTLQQLAQAPQQLHRAIEQQYAKRQVISVARKAHLYRCLCKAHLQYLAELPTMHADANTRVLYTKISWTVQSETIYAILRLSIAGGDNPVLQAADWRLHVARSDGMTHVFPLPKETLHAPLCIVVPLTQSCAHVLPEFELNLITTLADANDRECLAVVLPIEVESSAQTYAPLLSHNVRRFSTSYAESNLRTLIDRFSQQNAQALLSTAKSCPSRDAMQRKITTITYMLHLSDYSDYERIVRVFQVPTAALNGKGNRFALHYMTSTVHLSCLCIEQQHYLQLESSDPVALYYVKLYLGECLGNKQEQQHQQQSSSAAPFAAAKCVKAFDDFVKCTLNMPDTRHDLPRIYAKLRTGYAASANATHALR